MSDTKAKIIQLDWSDEDQTIVVTPESRDRYVLRVKEAIARLDTAQDFERYETTLRLLVRRLRDWAVVRSDLHSAYLATAVGGWVFVVVSTATSCSDELEDSLSQLERDIATDPDLRFLSMGTMSLYDSSDSGVEAFLDRKGGFSIPIGTKGAEEVA